MDKSDELQELFSGELTPENRDRRLLALADHLDTCKDRSDVDDNFAANQIGKNPPKFFTMETLYYSCGSAACLVGHGLVLAGQHSLVPNSPTGLFSDIYGVSADLATLLFAPQTLEYSWGRPIGSLGHITAHHAAAVIRHLVEIGVVDWDGIGQRLEADGTP